MGWEGGRVELREAREGYLRFAFDDYVGFTPRIWEDVVGGIEAVIGMMRVSRGPLETRNTSPDCRRLDVIVRYQL